MLAQRRGKRRCDAQYHLGLGDARRNSRRWRALATTSWTSRSLIARYFARCGEADAAADGSEETNALLRRLLAYKGVQAIMKGPLLEEAAAPVVFRKGNVTLPCSRPSQTSARRKT